MLKLNHFIKRDTIEAKISGTLDYHNKNELIDCLKSTEYENSSSNWIIDVRALEVKLSIGEAFFCLPKFPTGLPKQVAVIIPEEQKEFYSFLENAAYNRGFFCKKI